MSVKLGHFELLEQIGKGGMAAVFRAHDPSLNRKVAIKLLDEELARQDPQFVESFIHEAQTAAAINHPNIVQIYFVGQEGGNFFIAMELLEGRPLSELIGEMQKFDEETALKIGVQIAEALQAAYSTNQMVHGDIKPQNIFITSAGPAKLLDFGLAKMANIEDAALSDGSVWGSAYYISPERVGHKAEDFRSDIYSLGATLFQVLTGHPPFEAETPGELAVKRLNEDAPGLRSINPDISPNTERIVARMLNKNPMMRYLDYDSLVRDLKAAGPPAAAGPALNPARPAPGSPLVLRRRTPAPAPVPASVFKSKQIIILAGSIAAALLLCVGLYLFLAHMQKAGPAAVAAVSKSPAAADVRLFHLARFKATMNPETCCKVTNHPPDKGSGLAADAAAYQFTFSEIPKIFVMIGKLDEPLDISKVKEIRFHARLEGAESGTFCFAIYPVQEKKGARFLKKMKVDWHGWREVVLKPEDFELVGGAVVFGSTPVVSAEFAVGPWGTNIAVGATLSVADLRLVQ